MKGAPVFLLFVFCACGYAMGALDWLFVNGGGTTPNGTNGNGVKSKDQSSNGNGQNMEMAGFGSGPGNLDLLHVLAGVGVASSMNTNNLLSNVVGSLAAKTLAGERGGNQDFGRDGEVLTLLSKIIPHLGQQQGQAGLEVAKIPDELKGAAILMHLEKLHGALKVIGDVKNAEAESKEAVGYLCLAVKAVYHFAQMRNVSVYNKTDEEMKKAKSEVDNMSEDDKLKFMVNLLSTNANKFQQAFLFLADWSCSALGDYVNAVQAMKKMQEEAKNVASNDNE